MSKAPSAALAADFLPWPLYIEWRALKTLGVILITAGISIIVCAWQSSPLGRTGLGLLVAAAIIGGGESLSTSRAPNWQPCLWWLGTSMIGCGYAMAYFFAQAMFFISGVERLDKPQACWLTELLIVACVTQHANRNRLLRWLSLPFSVFVSGSVLLSALSSVDTLTLAGFTMSMPAFACVVGMAWWSLLSLAYRQLEYRYAVGNGSGADRLLFRIGGELCFGLSVVCAIVMPLYMNSLDYAPLWWSLEMPVLFALCRRSRTLFKPFFVMAIWLMAMFTTLFPGAALWFVSGFTTVQVHIDFNVLVSLTVPASGLVLALAHRLDNSAWTLRQRLTGYSIYLYGSVAAIAALLFLHLNTIEALPYWLIEAGVMIALALYLRDRALHAVACLASAIVLSVYGLHWHSWDGRLTTMVVVGSYAICLVYGAINRRGGLLQGNFAVWFNSYTVSQREARLLELIAAVAGYVGAMTGTFLLLGDSFVPSGFLDGTTLARWITWLQIYIHYNTIAWCFLALSLAAYGLHTNRLEHRFCGVLALSLAVAKLCIYDLSTSGVSGLAKASISTFAVAICCLAMGSLYIGTTNWLEQNSQHSPEEKTRDVDPPPDDDTEH